MHVSIYSFTDSNHYPLQSDINSLYGWSLDNLLSSSIKKRVVLHFKANSQIIPSMEQNLQVLQNTGIIFSNNLSWVDHIESIVANAYKSCGLLRWTFKHTFSIQVKRTLYLTLVRSKLLYCSPLWRSYLLKEILLLERVQCQSNLF